MPAHLDHGTDEGLLAVLAAALEAFSWPPRKKSSIPTSPFKSSRSGATSARRGFCKISQAVS
jgi:hypothetical protein